MINELHVANFQSHHITDIEFSPGVNVIVGPSDSGKTSLIRALRWLIFNQPQGAEFRSNWGGDTQVTGIFDDCAVARFKSNSLNAYMFTTTPGEWSDEYKAFGREVPQPVVEALNMGRINILNQHDVPFLLGWTPGERGSFLNSICNFEIIDRGIRNCGAMLRQERADIKSIQGELTRLEEQEAELPNIDEMDRLLSALEGLVSKRAGLVDKSIELADIVQTIEDTTAGGAEFDTLLSCEGKVTGGFTLVNQRQALAEERSNLKEILDQLDQAHRSKVKYMNLEKQRQEELLSDFPEICPLCGGEVDEHARHKILSG